MVEEIYPKHPQFKLKQVTGEFTHRTILNDYIELEFHPLMNSSEKRNMFFTNYIDDKGNLNVLIKIMVKSGHPKHLYHLLNEKENYL